MNININHCNKLHMSKRYPITEIFLEEYLNLEKWKGWNGIKLTLQTLCCCSITVLIMSIIIIPPLIYILNGKSSKLEAPHKIINNLPNEIIAKYDDYVISYNNLDRYPNYAFHLVKKDNFDDYNVCNKWTEDGSINSHTNYDYNFLLNIAKYQLVPSKDIENSCSSYNLANIIPVYNHGFKDLYLDEIDDYIRRYYNGFYVMTIPEYNGQKICSKNICLNVPTGIYKIILNEDTILCSIYIHHNIPSNITFNANISNLLKHNDYNSNCVKKLKF